MDDSDFLKCIYLVVHVCFPTKKIKHTNTHHRCLQRPQNQERIYIGAASQSPWCRNSVEQQPGPAWVCKASSSLEKVTFWLQMTESGRQLKRQSSRNEASFFRCQPDSRPQRLREGAFLKGSLSGG